MEILKTLAVVLSIGSLAGLNLYLTVFVSGLAMRFDWVTLPPSLNCLEVLGHPIVIALAGILYLFEFFADKIPWIDTAWDSVHTFWVNVNQSHLNCSEWILHRARIIEVAITTIARR